jgi:CheY-like chemotaxis protein
MLLLHIDDDPALSEVLSLYVHHHLGTDRLRMVHCATNAEALDHIAGEKPAIIAMDLFRAEGAGGIEFLQKHGPFAGPALREVDFVVISGFARRQRLARRCYELGAIQVFTKPFDGDEVAAYFKLLLKRRGSTSMSPRKQRQPMQMQDTLFSSLPAKYEQSTQLQPVLNWTAVLATKS